LGIEHTPFYIIAVYAIIYCILWLVS